MTELPGIVVPAEDSDLDEVIEEVSTHEPLMTLPQSPEGDEGWAEAFDALIAAGLFKP